MQQMKIFMERSPVAMLITTGPEERVLYANDRFTELFGYTQDDIMDLSRWWALAIPEAEDRAIVQAEWSRKAARAASDRADIEPVEATVTCKNGSLRHIVLHLSPIEDGVKNLVTLFDVTDRRTQQIALTDAENRYRQVFETNRDGYVIVDNGGKIIDCNQAFCRMLGRTLEELRQLDSFRDITPEKWHQWEDEEIWNKRLSKRGYSGVFEKEYIRKDGTVFPIELSAHVISDDEGKPKYFWAFARDITDKKKAERQLEESEKKHRRLIEMLQEGIWEIDAEANTTFVNHRMAEILGYAVEEMNGRSMFDFMDEEWKIQARGLMQRREQGVAEQHEFDFLRKDGTTIHTLLEAAPIMGLQGNFNGAVAGVIDITSRKEIEARLRDSEERYRTLVDMADDAILLTAPDGRILTANPGASRMFGMSAEEIYRRGREGIVVQDEKLKQAVAERSRKGFNQAELSFIKGDGEVFPGDVTSVVFQTDNGEQRTSMIIRDITRRKQFEKALLESEKRYRSLFEGTKDTITTTTPEGRILDVNPAAVELFGYESKEEFLREVDSAQKYYANVHDRERIIEELKQHGFIRDIDVSLRRKNGEDFLVSASFLPTYDEDGKLIALRGIFRDLSERRKLEEQLWESQKMESIGRLAGGVAHEFNNLLTSIQGNIELVLTRMPMDDPAREELVASRNSCRIAADIAHQLISFSRQQRMETHRLLLNDVIEDRMILLNALTGERYLIVLQLADDLREIDADQSLIGQVIVKLVINARDAMPEGGRITITTADVIVEDELARSHPHAGPGRFARLSVSDTGIGISEEVKAHIFEPFFSTRGAAESSGLGLAVIDGIIHQHRGWVDVASEPGRGSTFSVFLPVAPSGSGPAVEPPAEPSGEAKTGAPEPHEQTSGPAAKSGAAGQEILLVEDEESVRGLAEKVLSRAGYNVTTAPTAEEARRIFNGGRGRFQLLFSDIVLPGENGVDLATSLKREDPRLKVLLASGYSDRAGRPDIASHDFPLLGKPYSVQQLLDKVAGILSGEQVD